MAVDEKKVFSAHRGGKIGICNKTKIRTREDLSTLYTPGVAVISKAISREPEKGYDLTMKGNSVLIVTDGTAVLGLGDIGPLAALPVMEGKAMLFKEFGGIDAFPICLDTKEPEEIIKTVKYMAPSFGGINLEDISSPRCFYIEERLKEVLDIPVFHDDQHGTAVVVLAGLMNSLRLLGKEMGEIKIAISGAGAAGIACAKFLLSAGARNIVVCDRAGTIYKGRKDNMNPQKIWLSENSNPEGIRGTLKDAVRGADVFIGVSAPGLLKAEWIREMARDPIVFAMANPVPEVMPEDAKRYARIVATGRSDYPNQINNCLCFPGFFRGLLDSRAKKVTEGMKLASAKALAAIVRDDELREDYIIPDVLNREVYKAVASAVMEAARKA
ncbi:NADP-dependent malic enzyme [Pseudomonas sp.]|uniref:NAD(P)-dependent malic enzyme n=1 Tax=Pseudomonas sp. TaxID=306 RepID=UPI00271AED9C|nr:NADP-dependent malic enzyme [Pseudomonas sp.]MDO8707094.1 NADP-dependent malic enzyme [Pseudomonas sp.]